MSSRPPAHSLSFEIKSASLPLVSFVLRTADINLLAQDLQTRLGDTPDFFDNDPVLVDLQHLDDQAGPLDLPALVQVLRSFRMNPVALRPNNAAHESAAILAGLFLTTEARTLPPNPVTHEVVREVEVIREVVREVASGGSAMVVDKPLRSGQHVYAKGRDLVMLAMVNPGAEIMADGHIHVYAPLRGKAIAGAKGDTSARIFTNSLEAELLSIAGVYRTSDAPLPKEVAGKAAQVWLADDKLVMQAL
ncbi:MAG: septum site-determining protein MinC [Betaproteobacteria bacterium]|nr:septum site-determining protein MinC [Betaproteobacteria bacterium]